LPACSAVLSETAETAPHARSALPRDTVLTPLSRHCMPRTAARSCAQMCHDTLRSLEHVQDLTRTALRLSRALADQMHVPRGECKGEEQVGGIDLHAANFLVGAVLAGQHQEGGLDDATTQTQHQVQGGFWQVGKQTAIVTKHTNCHAHKNAYRRTRPLFSCWIPALPAPLDSRTQAAPNSGRVHPRSSETPFPPTPPHPPSTHTLHTRPPARLHAGTHAISGGERAASPFWML